MTDEVKTSFQGPGQWRSQARRLESEQAKAPEPKPTK